MNEANNATESTFSVLTPIPAAFPKKELWLADVLRSHWLFDWRAISAASVINRAKTSARLERLMFTQQKLSFEANL